MLQGYEEPVIATVGRAVLSGLNYMHPRGFIHRDIKGENVLVDEEGRVMLADFGVTAAMEPRPTQGPGGQQSGSPPYGTSNPSTEVGFHVLYNHSVLRDCLRHRRICKGSHALPAERKLYGTYK